MTQVAIMYPVFVQVLLTVLVYGSLFAARARAVSSMDRQRGTPDIAMGTVLLAVAVLDGPYLARRLIVVRRLAGGS